MQVMFKQIIILDPSRFTLKISVEQQVCDQDSECPTPTMCAVAPFENTQAAVSKCQKTLVDRTILTMTASSLYPTGTQFSFNGANDGLNGQVWAAYSAQGVNDWYRIDMGLNIEDMIIFTSALVINKMIQ